MRSLVNRVGRLVSLVVLELLMLLATGWGVLALRYWDHAGPWIDMALPSWPSIGALALLVVFGLGRWRWRALAVFAALFGLLITRWYAIAPSNDRNWQPECGARLRHDRGQSHHAPLHPKL